jgi:hypothetical protein
VRDCFLPAALWPRLLQLDAADMALALHLWAGADRDGIVPLDPALPAALRWSVADRVGDHHAARDRAAVALEVNGVAVTYDGSLFAVRTCGDCGGPIRDTPSGTVCPQGHGGGPVVTLDDRQRYVWIPDVAVHAPPPPHPPPRPEGLAPPPPHAVRALLTARLGREATDAECRLACPRAYGKRRAASPPMGDHIDRVYRAWAAGQVDKEGHPVALPDSPSPIQRRMIQGAMKEAAKDPAEAADALILIFQYVYGADEKPAKYLRGQNREGRAYVGLDNLTVTSKVQSRLAFARAWAANKPPPPAPGEMEGVTLGPLGRFR